MKHTWARCANCGKATWYCSKHGCGKSRLTLKGFDKLNQIAEYLSEQMADAENEEQWNRHKACSDGISGPPRQES